ncbi:MAG: hypothetical protein IT364_16085 [Candidatus Hydrogenedentes bacterium]|nr:hypothetical protein [Candidatus Hydrogenedentota bacterium]
MALGGIGSTCINHRSIESVGRCKQCGKPFCGACKVTGPTGLFCSEECKVKHENFIDRAQKLDAKRGPLGLKAKLRKLVSTIISLVVLALVVGVIASLFEIPVLSDWVLRVRGMIGM